MKRVNRRFALLAAAASGLVARRAVAASPPRAGQGVVLLRSAHPFDETIGLLKTDIAAKKIMFFDEIDQARLAAAAGIALNPSTLLVFGNPPLGIQFLTASPWAGLDWPVRLLATRDDGGQVWLAYTDFAWIARRHGIEDRDAAFALASSVVSSIAAAVGATPP